MPFRTQLIINRAQYEQHLKRNNIANNKEHCLCLKTIVTLNQSQFHYRWLRPLDKAVQILHHTLLGGGTLSS